MKKHFTRLTVLVLILSIFLQCAPIVSAAQEGESERNMSQSVTATVGGKTLHAITDPVVYWEVASGGSLSDYQIKFNAVDENATVIYTPWYPNTKTGRVGSYVEYVCQLNNDNSYVVTEIVTAGDGQTYIPVGGFVISVHTSQNNSFAAVGDVVTLGGAKITIPTKAVESDEKRIVIDYTNTNRSGPMTVYYDYQFGEKTGTNPFGSEVICQYNFEKKAFEVKDFRPFGTGDDSGSTIPDNGFVLSSYGPGYRQLLAPDQLFSKDDEVRMVGFDYIRFGGTVVGEYDYINPTKEGNPGSMETPTEEFPAYRGENQTMIYKDGWDYKGAAGTGTNVYGFEAAVDANGVVVELGVNVSKIPEGGYVISGHGKGRDFIRANVVLGATVVLNEKTQTYSVSTTLNSYYENLVTDVEAVISAAETRIKQLYDVDTVSLTQYIEEVRVELLSLKTVKENIEVALENPDLTEEERVSLLMSYNNSQLKIEKLRQQILVSSAESKAVSARAVWHRPTETTYEDLEANIRMYKKIGINLIFVETLYNGYSSFKSDIEEFPYHKNLASTYTKSGSEPVVYNDYLSAFVALCQEYGIEVHAWVENFYVGIDPLAKVVTMHPDWIMYNDDGSIYQRNEGGAYIFLDPTNEEVQNALIAYYQELFDKVPGVAGLNLDYIRYPVTDADEDSGYTIAAMTKFAEKKGMTFNDSQMADRDKMAKKFKQLFDAAYLAGGQEEADANYNDWVNFRINVVTEYVRRIKLEVKDTKHIVLSTSVFASVAESLKNKKQDWKTWFANGWIDIATPMAYYTDASDVLKNVTAMIQSAGNICYYYTGIASSYSGLPAWQNKEQIEASYLAGANGYVIFCSTQIIGHADVQEVLMAGVNSTSAVRPHDSLDKVLEAYFDAILDRAERLYIPAGGMTQDQYNQLQAKFNEILAMETEGAVNIYKIQAAVQSLYGITGTSYAKGYSGQRMVETFKEIVSLLDSRMSIALVASGDWNPEENPVRPTVTENGIKQPEASKPNQPVNPNGNTSSANKNNQTNNEEAESFFGKLWIILIIAVVVMLGSLGVIIWMAKSKKPNKPE